MASIVWNKLFDPGSPFSKLGHELLDGRVISVLNLKDDNSDALLVVYWIIHLRSEKVPSTCTFRQLLDLAILCDKYDCALVIKDSLRLWLDHGMSLALESGHEAWLFIGSTFRDARNLTELSKMLIEQVSLLDSVMYMSYPWMVLPCRLKIELIPDSILGKVSIPC